MQQRLVTERFIKDVDKLDRESRAHFETVAQRLIVDISRAKLEKLQGSVSGANAYSNRLNKSWRFIWTNELSPDILFRAIEAHDPAYKRRLPSLPRIKQRHAGIVPLSSLLGPSYSKIGAVLVGHASTNGSGVAKPTLLPGAAPSSIDTRDKGATLFEEAEEIPLSESTADEQLYSVTDDELGRIIRGDIASWMLFLAPEQQQFVHRVFTGPARAVGPAGSGKSVILLHRARAEASKGTGVLVVAYNKALSTVMAQLLDRLCGAESSERKRIEVRTLDSLAREVAGLKGEVLKNRKELLRAAIAQAQPKRLKARFTNDQEIVDLLNSEISGRIKASVNFIEEEYCRARDASGHFLSAQEWHEVLDVWRTYEQLKGNRFDWEDVRKTALEKAPASWYADAPAILVDEYQDLSPIALQLLMSLAGKKKNIFFCGDEQQRIYARRFSFASLGIAIRGNAVKLPKVHRNTLQIGILAQSLLYSGKETGGKANDEREDTESIVDLAEILLPDREGKQPVLAGLSGLKGDTEAEWVAERVKSLMGDGRTAGDILVLAPDRDCQYHMVSSMRASGLPVMAFTKDNANQFFNPLEVKVSTMHFAKGLESKVVFCTGLSDLSFRSHHRYRGEAGHKRIESLLHVACTRARDELYLSFQDIPLRKLCEVDQSLLTLERQAEQLIKLGIERLAKPANARSGELFPEIA